MKTILYCLWYLLFAAGVILMLMAFGDDERPFREWITAHLGYFAASMAAFGLFAILSKTNKLNINDKQD